MISLVTQNGKWNLKGLGRSRTTQKVLGLWPSNNIYTGCWKVTESWKLWFQKILIVWSAKWRILQVVILSLFSLKDIPNYHPLFAIQSMTDFHCFSGFFQNILVNTCSCLCEYSPQLHSCVERLTVHNIFQQFQNRVVKGRQIFEQGVHELGPGPSSSSLTVGLLLVQVLTPNNGKV